MKGFTPKWSVADFSSLINTRTGSFVLPVFMMALLLFSPLVSSIAVAATVHLEHSHKGEGETVDVAVSNPKSTVAFGDVRGNGVRGNMMQGMMRDNGVARNGVANQRANMMRGDVRGNGVANQRANMMRGKGMRAMMRGNMQVFNCLVSMYVEGGDASACHDFMHSTSVENHASFNSGGSAWFASPVLTNIPEIKVQPQHIDYAEQYIPNVSLENSTPPPEQA